MTARELRMIYREIPALTCRPGCRACCGPVVWTPDELAKVADRIPLGTKRYAIDNGATILEDATRPGNCPFSREAREGGACAVHQHRPFLCRLFGTVADEPRMTCPKGCRSHRPLSREKAAALTARYHASGKS